MKIPKKEIAVVAGSKSDLETLKEGFDLLNELNIGYDLQVISAHRHPEKLREYCLNVEKQGVGVIIACAGMAAALPGIIASYVNIPVIGVALKGGMLDGLDAVFSMVSIPKGLGIACAGIGKPAFLNSIILAVEILALKDKKYCPVLRVLKLKFK